MLQPFVKLITLVVALLGLATALVGVIGFVVFISYSGIQLPSLTDEEKSIPQTIAEIPVVKALADPAGMWKSPDWNSVDAEPNAMEIKYGKELIANTSEFLGPNGKVKAISNGMNCQNCHLQAGTAPLGNNYGAVAATYPKMRARSGTEEDIQKRINDCFERSLNGQSLERDSKEMVAMVAYINWVGKDVPKGEIPKGSGLYEVPVLDRAADPSKGKLVYENQCQSCHAADGQGMVRPDGKGYTYPPLWGKNSYNHGAGLYRLSRFAGYVIANMPLGASFQNPILSDEEAWDVAAYVNSMDRPKKDLSQDWPDISKKPVDHPFGPFSDQFTEAQHKFGPFKPIQEAKAKSN
ncbi:MAG: c-type cytochrome [Algoriphagus sp.]|jgi:thiosulfate dehydrogenase|uniref:c-type cytochrome n=1 Tax=Algoriphagus sp. TaxID=1872435 RepID=UPI002718E268|nr:c-type cytochrome [Algoriphagus sp.]MDO8966754.1 c-type cytochrome [Algoriphagus sp.]MDP2041533.1 c-type cytochrome [Algoriphagus sp.]MDP3199923.1 c-type cytochrome [Algoriphagus sp.]MDP3473885.1 c-type cytochrome [Algoriphagus sp.]